MTHPKLIFRRMQLPTIHIHTPRSENALTRSYKFGHYRSFLKVNKNTFFSKAYNLSMEYQNEMRPKGLVRGHLKISKKSNKTSKNSKLKKLCIVEIGHFCKIAKSQLSPKLQILGEYPGGPPFRVFSPPGYPFFPKPPFQVFDLPGVHIFLFASLIFA